MQGPFLLSEPVSNRREFAFLLVDETDGMEPELGEAGGRPQIRKSGETSWTDTDATLVHIGNGHYILTLISTELNTLGMFSIRYRNAGTTAEFQDTGKVTAESAEISLDEVNAKIDQMKTQLEEIEHKVDRIDQDVKPKPFLSPLS